MRNLTIIFYVILLAASPLHAQLVADGATNTLSNVTNSITGGVMVGTNGAFTLLVLSDNALLTNSANGVIGGNATARSNQVQLVSPSARWLMGGNLIVGSNGASSTLVVSNGALVENSQGVLGFLLAGSNNTALVTGAGSVWSNRQAVYVGQQGPSNRVRVIEGGRVVSASLDIGFSTAFASDNEVTVTGPSSTWSIGNGIVRVGNASSRNVLRVSNGGTVIGGSLGYIGSSTTASSNSALVTDARSRWQAGTNLYVGLSGALNRLVISNGGAVFSGSGNLGNLSTGDDNLAVVTGAGSLWHNTNNLSVGVAGARNQLVITNGGTVSGSNIVVGSDGASFANRLLVDSGTLRVASASGAGALDVRRGTNVLNAGLVDVDRLVLTNAAGVFEFKGGTLITRGAFITNGTGMIVSGSGANPAVWDVRPGATDHVVSLGVLVGFNSSFNQLLVSGGAVLSNSVSGLVGVGAGANSNSASVSGAGSRWLVAGEVAAGAGGAFNRLTVEDGGSVSGTSGRVGGAQLGSSNNAAIVSGAGSVWSNATAMIVGDVSPGNQLLVGGGGAVFAGGDLQVGGAGSFNSLVVSEGAFVSDYHGLVGNGSGSSNVAVVTGPGSVWTNTGFLYAGASGRGHQLIVSNGGMALSFYGDVGGAGQENRAVVTDPGSIWSISNSLVLGNGGTSNRVEVRNGGWLASGLGIIGNTAGSNALIVTGATSRWSNRLDQIVGNGASRNELILSDGGTAFAGGDGIIGDFPAARSNTVAVGGPGSRWLVTSNLHVGDEGSFNRLVVSNGGFVSSQSTTVGAEATASNNLALVTGAGSLWSNSSALYVGSQGSRGNQLVVTNGGTAASLVGVVGYYGGDNLAVVTGQGSGWDNSDSLWVGFQASGNRLVVTNGGLVVNPFVQIGATSQSHSNEMIVTGAGSVCSNRLDVVVGSIGSANRLVVDNGGTVFGSNFVVGHGDIATNNRVIVNGGTLRATNATRTSFLDVRRGTNVLNAGLVDVDNLVLTNKGIPLFQVFGNGGTNTIPAQIGSANPYPSTIAVAGLAGNVSKVTVTLSNLSHQFPDTVSILLRSPAGQSVMLMSGAGGFNNIANVKLVFDDNAATLIPDNSVVSGTNRPSYYPPDRILPGVPLPYATNLSAFKGGNPNGNWSLYIYNNSFNGGSLRGWSVGIETDAPFPGSGLFEFNGGTLTTRGADIENRVPFVIGGPGGVPAVWELLPGANPHFITSDVIVGSAVLSNSLMHVIGGTMNAGLLDIRGGTNRLDAGLVEVDRLVITNTRGQFEFNGGSLRTPDTTVANGRVFTVGNGTSTATLQLLGGTHAFSNNLVVANNASLIGHGGVLGAVTVAAGGKLTPGTPIGRIDIQGTLILQGTVNLQIDKSAGVRTNDQVTASGAIFFGGTLVVTDIGADELAAGDRFYLFTATPYLGGFSSLALPPLNPGLTWVNKLLEDGTIEVAAAGQPAFTGISVLGNSVILTGTNGVSGANFAVLTATNVALPLSNWTSLVTNQFGVGGAFSFTNSSQPGEPQRYFRIRTP